MKAMARAYWLRIRREFHSNVRYRITRAGVLFVLTTLLLGLGAFFSGNNLLFLLLAAMLATLLISGFVSRLSLAGLELEFQLPEHICARRPVAARVRVSNSKWLLPSFSIRLTGIPPSAFAAPIYFPVIPAKSRLEETVTIVFGRRGLHREESFQFATRFPFGFSERRVLVSLPREVLVYPSLDPVPGFDALTGEIQGELEARQQGRGHDFYRIRPYEPLESARHVDWRATAHTGELQVREFARETEPLVEIVLDLDVGPAERTWFETAVECSAYLAWRVLEREARVRFRTQEFDLAVPAEGDVYTILKYLALVEPRPGCGAIEFCDEESYLVLFTPDRARFDDAGRHGALVLTPDRLASPRLGAEPDRAGADLNHRHRDASRREPRTDHGSESAADPPAGGRQSG